MKAPEHIGGFLFAFPLVGVVTNHDSFITKQSILSIPLAWYFHQPIDDIPIF